MHIILWLAMLKPKYMYKLINYITIRTWTDCLTSELVQVTVHLIWICPDFALCRGIHSAVPWWKKYNIYEINNVSSFILTQRIHLKCIRGNAVAYAYLISIFQTYQKWKEMSPESKLKYPKLTHCLIMLSNKMKYNV